MQGFSTPPPSALRVMAEYMDDDPVWNSDLEHDQLGPVALIDLGVSDDLVRQLRAGVLAVRAW